MGAHFIYIPRAFNPLSADPQMFFIVDPQYLFQDNAGTIPVTDDGDPVGLWVDLSGNGFDLISASDPNRPIYRTNGTNQWLEFDGVNHSLSNSSVDINAPAEMFIPVVYKEPGSNDRWLTGDFTHFAFRFVTAPTNAVQVRFDGPEVVLGIAGIPDPQYVPVVFHILAGTNLDSFVRVDNLSYFEQDANSASGDVSTFVLASLSSQETKMDVYGLGIFPEITADTRENLSGYFHGLLPIGPFDLEPIAWWTFEDGSGTTPQDRSGNAHHGAFVNTPTWDAGPPVSLDFQAADTDGVIIANDELTEPATLTICAWLDIDTVLGDVLNIADTVALRMNSNIQFFYHFGGGNYRAGSGTFNDTGLHHLAFVLDPANSVQELYVDGILVGSTSFNDAIVYNIGTDTYIGRNPAGTLSYDGRMRQLLVFPSRLSEEQIIQIMSVTA